MKTKTLLSILITLLGSALFSSCVKSNLDNAFDPTTLPGLMIGMSITGGTGTGDSSSSSSTGDPAVSVCTDVTPTIVEFSTVGTTSYVVPAGTQYVHIRVIGGGGGGGPSISGSCAGLPASTAGGTSSVKIQSAATDLLSTTGGSPGICGDTSTTGIGGSGGTPNGVAGSNGTFSTTPAARSNIASYWGSSGKGSPGGATRWGGGAGGSGGLSTGTYSNLASETLDITVGAAGLSVGSFDQQGHQGHVQLILF